MRGCATGKRAIISDRRVPEAAASVKYSSVKAEKCLIDNVTHFCFSLPKNAH